MKFNILLIVFLLTSFNLSAQSTWTVDNRPGTTAQFTSIQAAHDAATPGDTLYVNPSTTSYGNITVTKTIHLIGLGHNPELENGLKATLGTITLSTFAGNPSHPSNSSFVGLNFTDLINSATLTSLGYFKLLIQNNFIVSMNLGNTKGGIVVQGNIFNTPFAQSIIGVGGDILISHNIFNIGSHGFDTQGAIVNATSSSTIANNIFIFNGTSGNPGIFANSNSPIAINNIFVINNTVSNNFRNPNSTVSFQNCLTFSYGGQILPALPGTNNLNNTNPQFASIGTPENPLFAYTKSYKLKVGSPALNAGSDGTDLGIYGQGFLFQMKGYPFELPYLTDVNITNNVVQAGSNLSVSIKASANVEN